MNHVSAAIKRSSLEKAGGYISLPLIEDYYLWVRFIANGFRLANINETLVHVRIGNGFTGRRRDHVRIKSWRILQDYMLKKHMISRTDAFFNMCYIKLFIYAPSGLKKLAYEKILRK